MKIFLLIILIFISKVNAQKNFFLRPKIELSFLEVFLQKDIRQSLGLEM